MFSKEDNDWWDILGGKSVPDADPEVALEAQALRGTLLTWKEKQDLPPLRLPILVKLSQWLQETTHQLTDSWLPKEKVLKCAFSRYAQKTTNSISRAKLFELTDQQVVLLVKISKEEDKIKIDLRVYPPKTTEYLPKGLRATVLDTVGNLLYDPIEVESTKINAIKLTTKDICYDIGEKFSVDIRLKNARITEYFEV